MFSAIMVPQTLGFLHAAFPLEQLATAIGIALGPIAGGLLINHASSRCIFIVNVPTRRFPYNEIPATSAAQRAGVQISPPGQA